MGEAVPGEVDQFARLLADDLLAVSGDRLAGVYLHGSAALGDFLPGTSDVDILTIVRDGTPASIVERIADDLAADRQCPGVGLEASVVNESAARAPRPPWRYVVHVTTDPADRKTVWCRPGSGDTDLILHYAVTRQAGRAVHGPLPRMAVGAIPRPETLRQLASDLRWAIEQDSHSYAVLNACRALRYRDEGVFCSKTAGAGWAVTAGIEPDLVERALDFRQAGVSVPLGDRATAFVLRTAHDLDEEARK